MRVSVVGATGAVGQRLLEILEARAFPIRSLRLFASDRSDGKFISFSGRSIRCEVLTPGCFFESDLVFFDASDAVSEKWAPQAAAAGAWVVDNSAAFRLDVDIPLIVPEVNGGILIERIKRGVSALSPRERIIAGPNCSTVQLVVALAPLRDHWGLRRVVVSTYQSTSGAGSAAMSELQSQTAAVLEGREIASQLFPHSIAFNCIPQIGSFKDDGTTSEEQKIMQESRKILGIPDLRISATAVRVPTLVSHGESVNVECEKVFSIEAVRKVYQNLMGLVLQDQPEDKIYPMGFPGAKSTVEGASGRDAVYLGRLRLDTSVESGLNFWIVADNLRKGAALNAIQIGEMLVQAIG